MNGRFGAENPVAVDGPQEPFEVKDLMTAIAAVPTSSLKVRFSPLNDRYRDSGVKNESLLPAKLKVSY